MSDMCTSTAGERNGLERVEYRDARVRIGRGVYDDPVEDAVGRLYLVHDRALMVRLEQLHFYALGSQVLRHSSVSAA